MKMATDDKRWAKKLRKFPPDTLYFISERTERGQVLENEGGYSRVEGKEYRFEIILFFFFFFLVN